MIRALRIKFIVATMLSLAAVLLVILGGVNVMSYRKVVEDANRILEVLSENRGAFPLWEQGEGPEGELGPGGRPTEEFWQHRLPGMSPETPYESRFFSVLLDEEGQVVQTDTVQIAAVDGEDAAQCALRVLSSGRESGFLDDYRYLRCDEEGGVRIIFLDCGRSLSNFRTTLLASLGVAALGLLAVLALLTVLSGRIIRPLAESYEKQKRFITDAGHELKTPLTIIGADTDLAEMECGENQWLTDIRRQAQRLTGLTNDLIYLSRMEEDQPKLQRVPFSLSDVAEELAQSFQAPARSRRQELAVSVQPLLTCTGDEKAVRQLISILLDNALKYSPAGGRVSLRLERRGRLLQLTVTNPAAVRVDREQLEHLFDRFYRADQSRSSQTGGHGLGLSIARSIVAAHRGKIRAESRDGNSLTITVSLPA